MLYYIKPTTNFDDLNSKNLVIVDGNGVPSNDFKIKVPANEPWRVIITGPDKYDGQIRRDPYDTALDTNQYLKLDTKGKKLRIVPTYVTSNKSVKATYEDVPSFDINSVHIETSKLKDVKFDERLFVPYKTNTPVDYFISDDGGVMPGSNLMITGDPGVGKSSNLMDILCQTKRADKKIRGLYISAEMNQMEVKKFEKYYPGIADIDFLYLADYVTEDKGVLAYQALQAVLNQGWDIVILDSLVEVLSIVQEDLSMTMPKAERWLLNLLNVHNKGQNKLNLYTAFLCIQQKNKSGQYVGSKRLEHMTSAFLQLKWDEKEKGKRYMVFEKNRNGRSKVKLYYNFAKENGVIYNIDKFNSELALMDKAANFKSEDLDEMDMTSFFDGLKEADGAIKE